MLVTFRAHLPDLVTHNPSNNKTIMKALTCSRSAVCQMTFQVYQTCDIVAQS